MAQALAKAPPVAVIDEHACIGCTLCIDACPVDAIVGAAQFMHTVIAAECTGCKLCLPPCPVDCITMTETGETWTHEDRLRRTSQYRRRHEARTERLQRERAARLAVGRDQAGGRKKQATIERVMQRARQRLRERGRS
jgi:electron transport complex protein RnfB